MPSIAETTVELIQWPCPPFVPQTLGARRRWEAAQVRRDRRLEQVKSLKAER